MPVTAEMHESNIRVYKVTPGTKSSTNPAVCIARLPVVAKQSRLPFAGSEISFQLLSNGIAHDPVCCCCCLKVACKHAVCISTGTRHLLCKVLNTEPVCIWLSRRLRLLFISASCLHHLTAQESFTKQLFSCCKTVSTYVCLMIRASCSRLLQCQQMYYLEQ